MKAKDLRQKSAEELKGELMALLEEQFKLRMQHSTAQLSNTTRMRGVRRDIARVRTLIGQQ